MPGPVKCVAAASREPEWTGCSLDRSIHATIARGIPLRNYSALPSSAKSRTCSTPVRPRLGWRVPNPASIHACRKYGIPCRKCEEQRRTRTVRITSEAGLAGCRNWRIAGPKPGIGHWRHGQGSMHGRGDGTSGPGGRDSGRASLHGADVTRLLPVFILIRLLLTFRLISCVPASSSFPRMIQKTRQNS